ncbi:hypothetical protein IFM89_035538, partial [Coptis chinensis]
LFLQAPKRGAKAPAPAKKKAVEKVTNPLFEKRAKRFGIGGALPPKKDLHRIQRGGTIQPFGCMLAVQERSLTVIAYSENTISFLDLDTQVFSDSLLSLNVRLLFTPASLARAAASREILLVNPIWVHSRNTQKPFYAILHRIDVGIVADLEPARSGDPAFTIVGVV